MNYTLLSAKWNDSKRRRDRESMCVPQDLFLAIVEEVNSDDYTLEFGSGLSTWAFAGGRQHLAIEQNFSQAQEVREAVFMPVDGNGWYEWRPQNTYRVILVDGPWGGNRLAGLETILACCQEDTVIFVDDIHRENERDLALALADRLNQTLEIRKSEVRGWARIG